MPATPQYLARYNSDVLPGFVQSESFESTINIAPHDAPYADGSITEYAGLVNKTLSLTLKVWEDDYAACKAEVQKAATILRKKRDGNGKLYIMYSDRYYLAKPKAIHMEKEAGSSVKILEYNVEFDALPWLISDATYTVSGGSGTLSTSGRTIDEGGWTYASVLLTGTNITVSGYTANGDFAGYISVSGAVTNLAIDSENYTATVGATNKNSSMRNIDYRMQVGPEQTYFTVTGATTCVITYKNRWYI